MIEDIIKTYKEVGDNRNIVTYGDHNECVAFILSRNLHDINILPRSKPVSGAYNINTTCLNYDKLMQGFQEVYMKTVREYEGQ